MGYCRTGCRDSEGADVSIALRKSFARCILTIFWSSYDRRRFVSISLLRQKRVWDEGLRWSRLVRNWEYEVPAGGVWFLWKYGATWLSRIYSLAVAWGSANMKGGPTELYVNPFQHRWSLPFLDRLFHEAWMTLTRCLTANSRKVTMFTETPPRRSFNCRWPLPILEWEGFGEWLCLEVWGSVMAWLRHKDRARMWR